MNVPDSDTGPIKDAMSRLRLSIYRETGGHCAYCGAKKANLTIDHIIPKCKGGTNERRNLIGCCRKCNVKKGSKDLIDFRIARGKPFYFELSKIRRDLIKQIKKELKKYETTNSRY